MMQTIELDLQEQNIDYEIELMYILSRLKFEICWTAVPSSHEVEIHPCMHLHILPLLGAHLLGRSAQCMQFASQ